MPLPPEQLQEQQIAIEERRAVLLDELRQDIERVRKDREELASPVPDPGDESVARLIAELDQADLGRDLSELRGLEAARARLAEGSYGTCAACGGEIGLARLRVNPAAVRCVDCQRIHEKTFQQPIGSSL